MIEDITTGLGIEINPVKSFRSVIETLKRIGIESRKDMTLYPSCVTLQKRGRYFILHFKEMFILDGKESSIEESDIERRNRIVQLLKDWGIIEVLTEGFDDLPKSTMGNIKVVKYSEKDEWNIVEKYQVGKH